MGTGVTSTHQPSEVVAVSESARVSAGTWKVVTWLRACEFMRRTSDRWRSSVPCVCPLLTSHVLQPNSMTLEGLGTRHVYVVKAG